jgi:Ni,Fe-hydrogenase III large subunit
MFTKRKQPELTEVIIGPQHKLVSTDAHVELRIRGEWIHDLDFHEVASARNFLSSWLSRNRLRQKRHPLP